MCPVPESARCPTCHQTARWTGNPFRPFCSERCKLRDLGNWAAERYRIAGAKAPAEDGGKRDGEEGNG